MDLVQRFATYRLIAIYLYADRYKTRPSRRATPKGQICWSHNGSTVSLGWSCKSTGTMRNTW